MKLRDCAEAEEKKKKKKEGKRNEMMKSGGLEWMKAEDEHRSGRDKMRKFGRPN